MVLSEWVKVEWKNLPISTREKKWGDEWNKISSHIIAFAALLPVQFGLEKRKEVIFDPNNPNNREQNEEKNIICEAQ